MLSKPAHSMVLVFACLLVMAIPASGQIAIRSMNGLGTNTTIQGLNGTGTNTFSNTIITGNVGEGFTVNLPQTNANTVVMQTTLAVGGTASANAAVITNKITSYNGDTTAGNGVGTVVGSVALTGQSVTIAATTIFTTPSAGEYMIAPYTMCTTSGTATGNLTTTITWTDENGAQSLNVATSLTLSTAGISVGAVRSIHCTSGTTIKYTATVSGATGSPLYSFYVAIVRLR